MSKTCYRLVIVWGAAQLCGCAVQVPSNHNKVVLLRVCK